MKYRYLFLGISLALNALLLWALVWGNNGLVAYENLEQEYSALNGRIGELNARNIELSREIRLLQSDRKYIEQTIRNRLNFVKDNEILYIFPDEQDAQTVEGANESKN
ncbi:MAG: septum formation initiator family protein [Deltaproteobacteria bacterium]|jgi:cell division protein FtsB|nr:septum formation initiator family protein [Deltaproteobacteria bacterium]